MPLRPRIAHPGTSRLRRLMARPAGAAQPPAATGRAVTDVHTMGPGVAEAVESLELLATRAGLHARLGHLPIHSPAMRAVALARAGEAAGPAAPLRRLITPEDGSYEHLLVWDAATGAIAGGCRFARLGPLLRRSGLSGMHSASLVRYPVAMLPRLMASIELGHAFVVPGYGARTVLRLVCSAVTAYLVRHPSIRHALVPVTVPVATGVIPMEHGAARAGAIPFERVAMLCGALDVRLLPLQPASPVPGDVGVAEIDLAPMLRRPANAG